MRNAARELRHEAALCDPHALCQRLGLIGGSRAYVRQAGGLLIQCPWHDDHTPSCSVRRGRDETIAVRCHACGASGDALSLIAAAERWEIRRDFARVIQRASELAGRFDLAEAGGELATTPAPARPPPAPRECDEYPNVGQVIDVWSTAGCVADDPEAVAMLDARGLDAEAIDDRSLARVIRPHAKLPRWAFSRGGSWTATSHRLILPVYDENGQMRSLRAWRLNDVNGDGRKRLPPYGHRAAGLVLADSFAVAMLRAGRWLDDMPSRVLIVEGEPDFLTWATRFSDADESAPLVLGVGNGSWTAAMAERIPSGAWVTLRTHPDQAGARYALEIWESLATRCHVRTPKRAPADL